MSVSKKIITAIVLAVIVLATGALVSAGPGKNGAGQKHRCGGHSCYDPPPLPTIITLPEGVVINTTDTGVDPYWVEALLRAEARQLDVLGPDLTIKVVSISTPSSTATSISCSGDPCVYKQVRSVIYLNARSTSGFWVKPEYTISHEYGHAWTMYHLYLTDQGDWTGWLTARGLLGDGRLESSYKWQKTELIADDYRLLFGSSTAISQGNYINNELPDPRTIPALRDFFEQHWLNLQ